MGKLIFLAVFAATVLLNLCAASSRWHRLKYHCFPDNATKAECFKDFPNNGAHTKTWLSWLIPREHDDSYNISGTTGLDVQDFVVDRIEQDANYVCEYKDQFIAGVNCLRDHIKTKCPFLSGRSGKMYDKFADGMTYICANIKEMDTVCLHTHWNSMQPCRKKVYESMKSDFEHFHHGRNHSNSTWRHHWSSNSSSSGDKNYTSGGRWQGRRPSSSGGWKGGKNITSGGWTGRRNNTSGGRWGGKNSTSGGWWGRKNSTSGGRWGRKNSTSGGWWGGKNSTSGGWWGRNASSNSSYNNWKSNWTEKFCFYKYEMFNCVREEVAKCHAKTADIMLAFMRNMTSDECQANMVEWDVEALTMKHVSFGDTHDGAVDHLPLLWLTLLLSAWVLMKAAI